MLSHPGPKAPRQVPGEPCSGEAALPAAARPLPTHHGHAFTFTPQPRQRPLELPPAQSVSPRAAVAEPGAGRLRPRPGWRHRLRKARTAAAAPPRCPQPPALTGTRSFVGGLGSARLHLPAESHRALLRRLPDRHGRPTAAFPPPPQRPGTATNGPRGPAPPALRGRKAREGRGKEALGSGGGVGVAAFFSPQPGLCLGGGDLYPGRALLINGYVGDSGQRSRSA